MKNQISQIKSAHEGKALLCLKTRCLFEFSWAFWSYQAKKNEFFDWRHLKQKEKIWQRRGPPVRDRSRTPYFSDWENSFPSIHLGQWREEISISPSTKPVSRLLMFAIFVTRQSERRNAWEAAPRGQQAGGPTDTQQASFLSNAW
jgi:hypothetical protein